MGAACPPKPSSSPRARAPPAISAAPAIRWNPAPALPPYTQNRATFHSHAPHARPPLSHEQKSQCVHTHRRHRAPSSDERAANALPQSVPRVAPASLRPKASPAPTIPATLFVAGWEVAANGFPEIPKGRNWVKIWYNPAVSCCLRTRTSCAADARTRDAAPCNVSLDRIACPLLQIIPLYAVVALSATVCGGYLIKYFSGNTEVNWAKSLRGTHDNQGINEARVASHNSRFGFRSLNKNQVAIFPFNFLPFGKIAEDRRNPAWDHKPSE